MRKGIDIIIVSFFSKNKLIQLIKSINESILDDFEIQVIIVNNSPQETLHDFTCKYEMIVIDNHENKGFGYGCNQALQYCKYAYQLLLNPDTVLFSETLSQSFSFLESHPATTVLGVKQLNEKNEVAFSCSRFPSLSSYFFDIIGLSKFIPKLFKPLYLMTDWNHLESRDVDQVMGSYLMIRNAFVKSYGLMDTRFFVFLEDADLCKRVWLNGGIVHYNSSISIIHEGGSSTDGISDKKTCYLLEGKLKYAYKYFEFWKYLLLFMMVVFIEPFSRVIFYLFKNPASIKDSLRGYLLFLKRHQFK